MIKKAAILMMAALLALSLAACGGTKAKDEVFSSLTWTGDAIEFTVLEDLTLTGISVFVGSQEFAGKLVSNSEGNMGFSNGTRLTPGSVVGFHGGLIILSGTTASCAIDTGGATPDKVCFYVAGGERIERKL